jgi:hypothetical protein
MTQVLEKLITSAVNITYFQNLEYSKSDNKTFNNQIFFLPL